MMLAELERALRDDTDSSSPDLAAIRRLGERARRRRTVLASGSAAALAMVVAALGWATLSPGQAGRAGPTSGGSVATAPHRSAGWPGSVRHDFNRVTANATMLHGKPATYIVGQTAPGVRRVTYDVLATHKSYTARTSTSGGRTTFFIVVPVPYGSAGREQSAVCVRATSWIVYVGTPKQLAHAGPTTTCHRTR